MYLKNPPLNLLFLVDENINQKIVRGLLRHKPDLDLVRVQDVGLRGADDPSILTWAANQNRILVTHDANTIPKYALRRLDSGLHMPGVVIIPQDLPIKTAIEDILLLEEASLEDELQGQIIYLPLQ